VELGVDDSRPAAEAAAAAVILLDTNALIWLEQGHARSRVLQRADRQLYLSPATLLELEFLIEAGRIRLRAGTLDRLADDDRWLLDDPPAAAWFGQAVDLSWTRDPFDRLLVAHARLRGWRFATSDAALLKHLTPKERLEI
jgi:PIN domain nuclease of toxin-antitoxin system